MSAAADFTKEDLLRQLAVIEQQEKEQEQARRLARRAKAVQASALRKRLMKQANYMPVDDMDSRAGKDYLWQQLPAALTAGVSRGLNLSSCRDYTCGCVSAYFVNNEENCMGYDRFPDLRDEARHLYCGKHGISSVAAQTAALDRQLADLDGQLAALEEQKRALQRQRETVRVERFETERHSHAEYDPAVCPAVPSRFPWNNKQVFLDLCAAVAK